ncbi:nuclear transport factor 2 family protein [uncultured Amnibacterium sp.]|uniref:nuclear transport factor 2 family protein n=1 Tax=uncultured Amnibacterium sp. TaxID=1631851 RepID=UPI0035CA1DAC
MALSTAPQDPAERLAWLTDREEIRALAIEFARSIDSKDQASYAQTFAEDGVAVLPFGEFKSRATIAAMHGPPAHIGTHHLLGQTVIDLHGDTATARTYLSVTHVFEPTDKTQKAHSGGWYEQELVRTAEGWRFARVQLVVLWEDPRPMLDNHGPDAPGAALAAAGKSITSGL